MDPRPPNVPVDALDASSSVLAAVAPTVLPPFTVPVNDAPGSITNRFAAPALNSTASELPLMKPALSDEPTTKAIPHARAFGKT